MQPTPNDIRDFAASPVAFRNGLCIDASDGIVPFKADDWQETDFREMDPAWIGLTGRVSHCRKRAFLERPRGHSKTLDLAIMALWALAFSPRCLRGVAAAGDKDQAALLLDAISKLVQSNPWLAEVLTVQSWKLANDRTGSELQILSSDVGTSFGLTPDFVVVDELSHWRNPELWHSLLSSSAKRSHCVLVIISNAGFGKGDSWQWKVRDRCRDDGEWYFSRLDGPVASWISQESLDEQKRHLPDLVYRRLWENEWTTGEGDALKDDDIDAAIVEDGPMFRREKGWLFVGGLDLGISRDHSALVTVAKNVGYLESVPKKPKIRPQLVEAMVDLGMLETNDPDEDDEVFRAGNGTLRVANCQSWQPPKGGKIDLEEVERAVLKAHQSYRFSVLNYDPWQCELLSQRLRRKAVPMRPITFTAGSLQSMATSLLERFTSRTISLYNDPDLIRDLRRLRIVTKSYGYRLDSPRNGSGHGDLATALVLAVLACGSVRPTPRVTRTLVCS